MADPFVTLQNGTVTLIRCNAVADDAGGPVAGFFDASGNIVTANIIAADVPAQIEYHRNKLLGNDGIIWDQPVTRSQRDIWLQGSYPEIGETGNGCGVQFTMPNRGTGFGRITDVEFDDE